MERRATGDGLISEFMATFVRRLAVAPRRRSRVIEETEGHLQDTADGLAAAGLAPIDAQRQAIARFGDPETAAAQFGICVSGRIYRFVVGLGGVVDRPNLEAGDEASSPDQSAPVTACDICGREVTAAERTAIGLVAVGEMASPVALLVHPACFDIASAVLALRGMPVTWAR